MEKLGPKRIKIVGFFHDDNPDSRIAREAGGHDFALVDNRYIVDPWVVDVENMDKRGVYDLKDPKDKSIIKDLYGDLSTYL